MPKREATTRLLSDLSGGDDSASKRLFPIVYDELRSLAEARLRGERIGHTLQPTALVHEAYIRLIDRNRADCRNRVHFFAMASTVIRQILIDHARGKKAQKRGGGQPVLSLDESRDSPVGSEVDFIALDDALRQLQSLDARQARVVELRFFGGLTVDETAEVMGVSPKTVKNDWQVARAWLRARLED